MDRQNRVDLTRMDIGGKIPPQATEFEEAVLGAILLEKTAYDRSVMLKPEYFYNDSHQYIYKAIQDLSKQSQPIDLLTVSEQLRKNEELDLIGGPYYLAKLTSKTSSAAHIEYHCAIIYQKYGLRELIRISGETITEAYELSTDLFELQKSLSNKVDGILITEDKEMVDLHTAVINRTDELAEIQKEGVTTTGIDTGWNKINEILHGWQKSDLIILAARPGQGKSAFAVNIAVNVARQNIPVAIFSLEMNINQLVDRIISSETNIGGEYIKKANLTDNEWNIISNTKFSFPLYIDDSPNGSLTSLKSKARRAVKKFKIKFLIVDYIQLMQAKEKGDSRQQEIGKITRGLKLLAKELDIPILGLAQLSREAEGVRPELNHLREGGDIEQDADEVIFIYDPQAHNKELLDPVVEIIIGKHRHGATGIKLLQFKKTTQKFIEYNEYFN